MSLELKFQRITRKIDSALGRRLRNPESAFLTPEFALKEAGRYAIVKGTSDLRIENAAIAGVTTLSELYHEGTKNYCVRTCAFTIDYLIQSGLLNLFSRIGLVMSYSPPSGQWWFDTFLLAQAKNGTWFGLSPAVHHLPDPGNSLFEIISGPDAVTVIEGIGKVRPGWKWPRGEYIENMFTTEKPRKNGKGDLIVQVAKRDRKQRYEPEIEITFKRSRTF